ncbi:hypothetical protein [Halalkalibacter krulwichiae]|uniref:Uncharacterized protein n=1 Tax=Halalkalibacter krulwichiae TaxID=199441 RepID=A0A1X9MBR1_9BACI|nr:hypothetical protein [Halalkalibacter krulwichiae]ARK29593.1 hypothetical protein BkAM31D_06800 [Halalkalibacter krulwichiae]
MEGKPNHYDGSGQNDDRIEAEKETFKLTEEARTNISGNPFFISENE